MSQSDTDRTAERILRRERARMLRAAEADAAQIDAAYQRAGVALKRRLEGVTARAEIERITRQTLNDAVVGVLPVVEASVISAATVGATTVNAQASAILGATVATASESEAATIAFRQAQAVLRGQTRADGLTLTARLRRQHRAIAARMTNVMTRSIQAGESMTRTAERLLDVDNLRVELPLHVRELRDAAEAAAEFGDPAILTKEIRRWEETIASRGATADAFTIRTATEQLVQDLERAVESMEAERIGTIVDRWAIEKARYRARVIARSETVEAHRRAYVESTREREWVHGYRWSLGSGHKKPDECDILASQDLYGLGPGGYPVDALPPTPHPSDLCTQTAIIDRQHNRRQLARQQGAAEPAREWESGRTETSVEWLQAQPESMQRDILGPGRLRIFQEQPERVLGRDGVPRPLWRIEGRPRPVRGTSETRTARPLVRGDRARGQVRPFPEI